MHGANTFGCRSSIIRVRMEVNDPLSFYLSTVLLEFAPMKNIFPMVLASGNGKRLSPLTKQRAKSTIPFGGKYRIIDFLLSNCLNSSLRTIAVLIQCKPHSLDRHIRVG